MVLLPSLSKLGFYRKQSELVSCLLFTITHCWRFKGTINNAFPSPVFGTN